MILESVFAQYISQNGSGPGIGDSLLLAFNVPLETIPVYTASELAAIITFEPPFSNVTYFSTCVPLSCQLCIVH